MANRCALTVSAATTVQRYLPYVTVLIGTALVGMGIWLLAGRELALVMPKPIAGLRAPTIQLGSMYGYGVSYAVASLSCTVGPFLAVTAASLRGAPLPEAWRSTWPTSPASPSLSGCWLWPPLQRVRRWRAICGESCRGSIGSAGR